MSHPIRHAPVRDAGKEGFRQGANAYRPNRNAAATLGALMDSPYWRLMRARHPLRARVYSLGLLNGWCAAEQKHAEREVE